MRSVTQQFLILVLLLCACQRPASLDSLIDAIAAGDVTDAGKAREALTLANTHELVVVRRGLADALLHLEGTEFGAELRRAVLDPHPMVRLQAARAFERWGTIDDLEALDQAAAIEEEGATPESAGATAANAAVRIRLATNPEPAQRALGDLSSEVPQVRVSGAVNLGYYRWPPSVAPLQAAVLNESDELVRAMAACALGSFDAAAVAPVFDRLQTLLTAPPLISRRCAVKAIGVSDRPEAATLVARAMPEKDPLTRRWAVEGLHRLHAAAPNKALLFLTARRDVDVAVRAESVLALADIYDAQVDGVWRLALTDAVPRVRAAAAYALVHAGMRDVVATALRDPAWEVRAAVLIAMTRRQHAADGQR
jgi:HEAT repeat protein